LKQQVLILRALAFLILLSPSVQYAWQQRDLPGFGKNHDDAILFSSAKSLASGEGYAIASLPERPAQTKYPVLYPLYLSAVWRIAPQFPANLSTAMAFSWPLFAVCLGLCWLYLRGEQLGEWRIWTVLALLAINPYLILFGCSLFSEVFFMCWLLACLCVARKETVAAAVLAGALAGCAYLSRTAGIALLISMPAWYLWRRRTTHAAAFAAGMLPFVLGWSLWSALHRIPVHEATLADYTDYVKFEFMNIGLDNIAVVLWKNIDALLYSAGSLILPQVFTMPLVKNLTIVIAIAMIAGVVRLVRRGIAIPYALFALVSALLLVVWHFPPTERFVLPIIPLLAAGLVVELDNLAQTIGKAFRHKDASQRVVAFGFSFLVATFFLASLAVELFVTFKAMPEDARLDRAELLETRATYEWIARNTPAAAAVLSNDDPLLYLYAGRRGNAAPFLPRWWYAGDSNDKMIDFFKDAAPYAKSRGLAYILATSNDLRRWGGEEKGRIVAILNQDPRLEQVYKSPSGGTLYRVK
jgi:hypothetical protein